MPRMQIYMFSGLSISVFIISGCILISNMFLQNKIINVLNKTGQLALTFYVAHVVYGMGIVDGFGKTELGSYPVTFSFLYALIFSLCCAIFASLWLRVKKAGPLEWIMRKLT